MQQGLATNSCQRAAPSASFQLLCQPLLGPRRLTQQLNWHACIMWCAKPSFAHVPFCGVVLAAGTAAASTKHAQVSNSPRYSCTAAQGGQHNKKQTITPTPPFVCLFGVRYTYPLWYPLWCPLYVLPVHVLLVLLSPMPSITTAV